MRRLAAIAVVVGGAALAMVIAPATVLPESLPTGEERRGRESLVEVADAWAIGGGTFGYPFWDKAGRRWAAGQITTTMYREYVTGYRDRLRGGCELLDAIRVKGEAPEAVADLVRDACSERLDALRAQHRWLDALIALDVLPAVEAGEGAQQQEERKDPRAALQATAAEHEAAYREALQSSFRDARIAMNLAQEFLDSTAQPRLPEDAFI